jgi:RND family efflux transporter MFP subunit
MIVPWVAAGAAILGVTIAQSIQANGPVAESAPLSAAVLIAAEGRVAAYPGAEVRLRAELPGRLVQVLFQEQQLVAQGDLLAQVDPEEAQAAIAEVLARISEAEAEIHLAEANLERRRALVAEQIATRHDLDQSIRDLDVARARLETARAERSRLKVRLRQTRIVAPLDGTITDRSIDTGEFVEHGDPIATITDLSRLRIEAEADEADAASLAVGARVKITAHGYPDRSWSGSVEEVSDTVTLRKLKPQDPGRPTDTRILGIKVAFTEPSPLKLGTTVELRIEAADLRTAR